MVKPRYQRWVVYPVKDDGTQGGMVYTTEDVLYSQMRRQWPEPAYTITLIGGLFDTCVGARVYTVEELMNVGIPPADLIASNPQAGTW